MRDKIVEDIEELIYLIKYKEKRKLHYINKTEKSNIVLWFLIYIIFMKLHNTLIVSFMSTSNILL